MKENNKIFREPRIFKYGQSSILTILLLLISLTLFRCANLARPTGGPKDSIPPKILKELPPNFTRNFKDKKIVIEFDEFIKFNNQNKEFSISPDLDKQPEYKIKKKFLYITLPDSLEKNTTYTINLGKGLVDYNEGNPLRNYSYVFSTGPELDSLTLSGSVKNAFTKTYDITKDKDVKVILIPTSQDSIFGKKKANIFSLVDSSGNFKFNNLRKDTYRIYALKEQNNDRIYNSSEESIGFIKDSIYLDKNISDIKIEYSKTNPDKFKLLDRKIEKDGRITLVFNQPIDTLNITIITPNVKDDEKVMQINNKKDSVIFTLKNNDFDSIKFEIKNNLTVLDTVLLRKSKNLKVDKTIQPITNFTNKVDKIKHITLTSTYPIETIVKEKLTLMEDSVERKNFQLQKDSINSNLYYIRYNWKPKKNYELVLQEHAIVGPFKETNKQAKYNFILNEADNYGDIKFNLGNLEKGVQYIVELIDDKNETVYDTKIIKDVDYIEYLKFTGGKYRLRIIKDLNKNGRWDPANVKTKTYAEPVWYIDKPFTIRSNWEQNEKLEIVFE